MLKSRHKNFVATALRMSVLFSALTMTTGCVRVLTDQYIHEATDKIRLGQYNSSYYEDASNAFPAKLDGIIIAPEFARRVSSTASLYGYLFIVARSDHSLVIKTINMRSQDTKETLTINPDIAVELSYVEPTNLWKEKVRIKLPTNSFADAETIDLLVIWLDKATDTEHQTELRLQRERTTGYAWVT